MSKAYELLGVKPGVSIRELKAAHRDLAKVWHPDRFQHDPRLQEKAQEKLKEINEAYDLLSSGKSAATCFDARLTETFASCLLRTCASFQTTVHWQLEVGCGAAGLCSGVCDHDQEFTSASSAFT